MSAPDFDRADYIKPKTAEPTPQGRPGRSVVPTFDQLDQPYRQPQPQQAFAPAFDQAQDRARAPGADVFLKALLFGGVAALAGSLGWGIFAQTGFMVSIVAIAIAYLVARAMMTATGGLGGRAYQIAAVALTYLSCNVGDVWGILIQEARHGEDVMHNVGRTVVLLGIYGVAGPFLELKANPLNGGLGLLILFFGLRTAWRMARGSAGFGGGQAGPSVGPFGMR